MRVHVGSKNVTKVQAVKDAVKLYPKLFVGAEVVGLEVDIPLYGHPKTLDETVAGAIARAKKAFEVECNFSFGLEGGLLPVSGSRSGYMETSVCAIYDGKSVYLGMGPSFEWPKAVTELVVAGKMDASSAFKHLKFTDQEKLGNTPGGVSGYLSNGRMKREHQVLQSIITALFHLENPEIYGS